MRKEEIVSGIIMCIVSGLVLIGFTIAWYTNLQAPVVAGIHVMAAEVGSLKVDELEPLPSMEPGVSGCVTLQVTPDANVTSFKVEPRLMISQDGTNWYTSEGYVDGESEMATYYDIASRHIEFYRDAAMTVKITAENLPEINLAELAEQDEGADAESGKIEVKIYWKWHYEYPFTQEELEGNEAFTAAAQKQKIYEYDVEDMTLGNNIPHIKFDFVFSVQ